MGRGKETMLRTQVLIAVGKVDGKRQGNTFRTQVLRPPERRGV